MNFKKMGGHIGARGGLYAHALHGARAISTPVHYPARRAERLSARAIPAILLWSNLMKRAIKMLSPFDKIFRLANYS